MCVLTVFKGTQSRFCACARLWFLNGGLRIQNCGDWHIALTNPFASSSVIFVFALKLLRIKGQWYTVLVKCQFVCNRGLSVLTSMPFDGTSSGGKCYGGGRRRLSFWQLSERFRKSGKDWEVMEPATQQDFCKETDSQGLAKTKRIALVRAFLCWHFTRARQTFTRWFSFSIFRHSIRFSSLRYTLWDWLRFICF